jgi:hypothetical protein
MKLLNKRTVGLLSKIVGGSSANRVLRVQPY